MKKLTVSLAFVGTVLVAGAQAAESINQIRSHQNLANHIAGSNLQEGAGVQLHNRANLKSQLLTNNPILEEHGIPDVLGAIDSSVYQERADRCDDETDFHIWDKEHQRESRERCDCRADDWGCEASSPYNHKPSRRTINENRSSVSATVVPVQVLNTTVTQNIQGEECAVQLAKRERHDYKQFAVEGRFKEKSLDVQQLCNTESDCFTETGAEKDNYWDVDMDHGVGECECRDIDGRDFLGFDEDDSCDCRVKDIVEDPDRDIEKRITHTVEKTISDLLSEIVNRCISESLTDLIKWD